MSHPFRRYCFYLAQKLGKSVKEVQAFGSDEISAWMAYDLTLNEQWSKKYEDEKELERQKDLSDEERANMFRKLLGGK